MTRLILLDELVKRLQEIFTGWTLLNKDGELHNVKVFAQYMPNPSSMEISSSESGIELADKSLLDAEIKGAKNKRGVEKYDADDYEKNFPCVVVKIGDQIDGVENGRESSKCSVRILTGIYDVKVEKDSESGILKVSADPECQGYRDVLNIQERIREDFCARVIIGEKFVLQTPIKHRLLDVETWPIFFGEQEMIFEMGRPQMQEYVYKGKRRIM